MVQVHLHKEGDRECFFGYRIIGTENGDVVDFTFNEYSNINKWKKEKVLTKSMVKEQIKTTQNHQLFVVPDGIVKLDIRCFYGTNIEKVVLPQSVREIGAEAFNECSKMKEINLPEGLEIIRGGCFRNTAIEEIVIPRTVKSIGDNAFSGYVFFNSNK